MAMPKSIDWNARRQQLGEAVLGVLAREGAENLTLRNVAAKAGWSVGVVQHYFKDRDELVGFANELAFERADRRIQRILEQPAPALTKLRRALEEVLPLDRPRIEETTAWVAFWNRALTEGRLRTQQIKRYTAWREFVRGLLKEAQAEGDIQSKLDVAQEGENLVAFVDGIAIQALFEPRRLAPAVLERMLQHALQRSRRIRSSRGFEGSRWAASDSPEPPVQVLD
jgi:AcrR family transcriptional regulator